MFIRKRLTYRVTWANIGSVLIDIHIKGIKEENNRQAECDMMKYDYMSISIIVCSVICPRCNVSFNDNRCKYIFVMLPQNNATSVLCSPLFETGQYIIQFLSIVRSDENETRLYFLTSAKYLAILLYNANGHIIYYLGNRDFAYETTSFVASRQFCGSEDNLMECSWKNF